MGEGIGPQVNMFEQVSSDARQMSVAGWGGVTYTGLMSFVGCDNGHVIKNITCRQTLTVHCRLLRGVSPQLRPVQGSLLLLRWRTGHVHHCSCQVGKQPHIIPWPHWLTYKLLDKSVVKNHQFTSNVVIPQGFHLYSCLRCRVWRKVAKMSPLKNPLLRFLTLSDCASQVSDAEKFWCRTRVLKIWFLKDSEDLEKWFYSLACQTLNVTALVLGKPFSVADLHSKFFTLPVQFSAFSCNFLGKIRRKIGCLRPPLRNPGSAPGCILILNYYFSSGVYRMEAMSLP